MEEGASPHARSRCRTTLTTTCSWRSTGTGHERGRMPRWQHSCAPASHCREADLLASDRGFQSAWWAVGPFRWSHHAWEQWSCARAGFALTVWGAFHGVWSHWGPPWAHPHTWASAGLDLDPPWATASCPRCTSTCPRGGGGAGRGAGRACVCPLGRELDARRGSMPIIQCPLGRGCDIRRCRRPTIQGEGSARAAPPRLT